MRKLNNLFETLSFTIKVLLIAFILLGLSNLVLTGSLGIVVSEENRMIFLVAEMAYRVGCILVQWTPLLFLIKAVSRKVHGVVPITSAIAGYIIYLVVTMYLVPASLPTSALSNAFGISVASSSIPGFAPGYHYPIQTGLIGAVVVGYATRVAYRQSRHHGTNQGQIFMGRDMFCFIMSCVYSILAAVAITFVWPYFYSLFQDLITFISTDITNPMNILAYGVADRLMSVAGLGNLLRSPFWYSSTGGSWINIVGESIAGDINIWTAMLGQGVVSSGAGRLITPYYVLNLFAVPGMLIAFHSLSTDAMERRRTRLFYIMMILISMISGTLLPLEIVLLLTAPMLFLFHLACTGFLFGLFSSLKMYLGYSFAGGTIYATPGNLVDFIRYFQNPNLQKVCIAILVVGVITFAVYLLATRFYFKYLAIDLFGSGILSDQVKEIMEIVGGAENIKFIHASIRHLTVQVYDFNKIDEERMRRIGYGRIHITRAGYVLDTGSGSLMMKKEIEKNMRRLKR